MPVGRSATAQDRRFLGVQLGPNEQDVLFQRSAADEGRQLLIRRKTNTEHSQFISNRRHHCRLSLIMVIALSKDRKEYAAES